jgi:nitrogen regulatory protein P-II 1
MDFTLVVAIVPPVELEAVEERLKKIGVRGITVSKAKGYGAYANFFSHDWMVEQVRVEVFAERDRAELIAQAIMDAVDSDSPGAGIVAILPVEKVYSVRTRAEAVPNRPRR